MENNMNITNNKRKHWLTTHGDRTEEDVKEDKNGEYVFMGSRGFGYVKVYLPDDIQLSTDLSTEKILQ